MEMILTFEPTFLINIYFLYVGLHGLVVTEVLVSFGVNIGVLLIPSFQFSMILKKLFLIFFSLMESVNVNCVKCM